MQFFITSPTSSQQILLPLERLSHSFSILSSDFSFPKFSTHRQLHAHNATLLMRGCLILLEGLDRTGKSTQADILASVLKAKLFKFPDRSTPIGALIDQYLVDPTFHLPDQAAHLLFSANRWELENDIVSTLELGQHVVMDRYIYSGIAYSLAKASLNEFDWLYSPDKGLPKPDLTMFLTIDLAELSKRKGWGEERYEKEEFQKIVKECFLRILDPNADKTIEIVTVDSLLIEEVTEKLMEVVESHGVDKCREDEIQRLK